MHKLSATITILSLAGLASPARAESAKLTGRSVETAARNVLLEILASAKLRSARVTSTTRTAAQQAKVMFRFVNKNGYNSAIDLYGTHGDAIIRVCEASYQAHGRCAESVLEKMVIETRAQIELLEAQGDKRTELMHTSDTHYTIDIDPESVANRPAFEQAVAKHPRVSRFLKPPLDRNSYHLEIPRN
jgi:hypothetical protein